MYSCMAICLYLPFSPKSLLVHVKRFQVEEKLPTDDKENAARNSQDPKPVKVYKTSKNKVRLM